MTNFNQYKNLEVFVTGGGVEALEYALKLSQIARKVVIINKNATFNADEKIIGRAKDNPKIDMLYNTVVAETKTIEDEMAAEIVLVNRKSRKFAFHKADPKDKKIGVFICP